MRAAIFSSPGDITVETLPDPVPQAPTDAVIRVTLACVCGSDLWYWRGIGAHDHSGIGHEAIGIVEATGSSVTSVREGDLVIVPFAYGDGTCPNCAAGIQTACLHGGGETDLEGVAGAYAAMDERRAIKSLLRTATSA